MDIYTHKGRLTVNINGDHVSLRSLAVEKGVPFTTLWGRISRGSSLGSALKPYKKKPYTLCNGYPSNNHNGKEQRYIHIVVAEKALGKKLPLKAEVHHVNGSKEDYSNKNLVICEDRGYHHLLHTKQRALEACGNANYRKCEICKQWDNPSDMYVRKDRSGVWHRACGNRTRAERKRRNNN